MMDYRSPRGTYRQQRRSMRNSHRGVFGGIGGSAWLIILLVFFLGNHWLWFPLMFLAVPFFIFVLRPMFFGSSNSMNNPPQYNQYQQPQQPVYQQDQPVYQPYTQGYRPQEAAPTQPSTYQEAGQDYAYPTQQQYEDPLIMYPQQEMPPQEMEMPPQGE